jgi:hypothetical protein
VSSDADVLYELLPAFYRMRDTDQGLELRALLRVVAEQLAVVEDDIGQLYDDWFIETCQDWVTPYIGDLVGYELVHEAGEPSPGTAARDQLRNRILEPRSDVAHTVRDRRRKGTLALLDLLARDAAGWPSRAVELYRLLGWNQHVAHVRQHRGGTADLRRGEALDLLDGPFDRLAHTVDVRRIASHRTRGRFNVPSVGVFVWRLRPYSVTHTPAHRLDEVGGSAYAFSVLGNSVQLFNRPRLAIEPVHVPGELDLPTPIRRRGFERRTRAGHAAAVAARVSEAYYGPDRSVTIWAPGWPRRDSPQPIPAAAIVPADLTGWTYRPRRGTVAVDPVLGRIAFPGRQLPRHGVWVAYQYALSADLGGGEYERPLVEPALAVVSRVLPGDLLDAAGLTAKLVAGSDPVSAYVASRLPATALQAPEAPALAEGLSQLLDDPALYNPERFAGTAPSPEAASLLALGPSAPQLVRLNRLLLEAAYPAELRPGYRRYEVARDGSRPNQRVEAALAQWRQERPRQAVIEIVDSELYVEHLEVLLEPGQALELRAASGARPVIRLVERPDNDAPDGTAALVVAGQAGSRFALDGLLVTGQGVLVLGPEEVAEGDEPVSGPDLCEVVIRHCTLVPGWALDQDCCPRHDEPSLELVRTRASLTVERSILGPIQVIASEVQSEPLQVRVSDSVIDATDPAGFALSSPVAPLAYVALTIARCTVFGQVHAHAIDLAENCIFDGLVRTGRRQRGCARFCYVPPGSRTPKRFECQPELAQQAAQAALVNPSRQQIDEARAGAVARVRPAFNSVRYGTPDYCQLALSGPVEIARGADDESEMGVFHDLYQPQRAANLGARLDEYTPAGMEAGVVYAT